MNNQKFKADPYNFSNKLITKPDVIDILKKVNMNDFTPNNIKLYQEAFVHSSYNFLEDYKEFEKPENCLPLQDKSYETLDMMVEHVASIIDELGLSYRILKLCGGDLSFASSLTFDFEVFSPGQKKWLEVSSVSNFESYQANRLKLRYKDNDGKIHLCHTLNGSALALPRIYAALLENNQTSKGIKIPDVLQKYTGFDILL